MIILTIRTDKPEAEVGLYEDDRQLAYRAWPAHRQLAETLHRTVEQMLRSQHKDWQDLQGIQGIVCFQGPGSFTGLRIGLTVGNALAYSYRIPIVASQDPQWLETGVGRLLNGESDRLVMPFYGAEANITVQKK